MPHLADLYRSASFLVRNSVDAEDLIQEVYLEAWKSFHRFELGTNCRKTSGGVDLYDTRLEGMSVVGFETRDYLGFVVSDLGRDEMVQLASPLAEPMRDALNSKTESGALPPPRSLSS